MNQFRGKGLKREHFDQKVNYIIDNFLVEHAITTYFAPPKNGKSRYSLGLSKYLLENTDKIVQYFDFDNSLAALTDRNANAVIDGGHDNFDYIHPEITPMTSSEVISGLVDGAQERCYDRYVMIFDSITDFVNDVQNEILAKKFMNSMKRLRNAGATIILLHHSNKNEKNYQGSAVFKSASDNFFFLHAGKGSSHGDLFFLDVDAGRFHVENCAFRLTHDTYQLVPVAYDEAIISPMVQEHIDKFVAVMKQHPDGAKQGVVLEGAGYKKADKTSLSLLAKYEGRFWKIMPGKGTAKIYTSL